MSKKVTRIFQEQALIEKTLLKNISEYRPTGDEDFDSLVRQHLMKDVHDRSVSFILSLYDIAWDMTFGEWQDFWSTRTSPVTVVIRADGSVRNCLTRHSTCLPPRSSCLSASSN